jgi:hypothetical protein
MNALKIIWWTYDLTSAKSASDIETLKKIFDDPKIMRGVPRDVPR